MWASETRQPWLLLLLALLSIFQAACNDGPASPSGGKLGGRRLNVLLLTLDTTRADALGCYGNKNASTPHLDALAAKAVLFQHAYTPVPITLPAHCSILTGTTPLRHGVHLNGSFDLDPKLPTLAETLQGAGYRTAAVIGAFPLIARFHLDRGFESFDEEFPYATIPSSDRSVAKVRHHERNAGAVVNVATAWLDSQADDCRWFLWCHFFDPHDPYQPPSRFAKGGPEEHYAGEVSYMDQEIGRLLAHITKLGADDKTLIVVVGDHGESLGEHGEKTHSYFLYDSTVRVPLLIRAPGISKRRVSYEVGIIDVMPTIAELVGAKIAPVDGESLVALMRGAKPALPRIIYAETMLPSHEYGFAPLFSVRLGQWKYVQAPDPELYDTSADPAETNNVVSDEPDRLASLREHLEKTMSGNDPANSTQAMDPETRARLATLGYARLGAPLTPNGQPRKDPKEMVELHQRMQAATALGKTGRWGEAIERLEEIEPEFEWSFVHRVELGSLYYMQGQARMQAGDRAGAFRWYAKAREKFETVLELEPKFVNAILNVGNIAYLQKDYDTALPSLEKVIELDPQKWEAYLPLCGCLTATGSSRERIKILLEKLVTLDVPPMVRSRAETALKKL